jgi:transcriptional regulator with XRE-family HTH domain
MAKTSANPQVSELEPKPLVIPVGAPVKGSPAVKVYRNEGQRRLSELPVSGGDIARSLSVSPAMATYWRNGTKLPTPERRSQIARLYGIPADAWDRVCEAAEPPADGSPVDPAIPIKIPEGMTLEQVDRLVARLMPETMKPDLAPSTLAQVSSTITQLLRLRAALVGDSRTDEAKLAQSPSFRAAVMAVVEALRPFPDALRAVEAALGRVVR